jgi:oligoendopeptidase F
VPGTGDNPEASPADRKRAWRDIEKKYIPYRDYEGNEFLEEGGYWQQQLHIYTMPFYYIDYALAYISSLQFWKKSFEDRESAWKDYVDLCSIGGSKSFVGFIEHAHLISPFDDGGIKSVVGAIQDWLGSVDDTKL